MGWGTGQGKSLLGTEVARLRGAKRVLIVAPSATFDGWYNTVMWQTGQKLRRCANNSMKFDHTPDPADREHTVSVTLSAAECKANLEAVKRGDEGWFFVTREMFTIQAWTKVETGKVDPRTGKKKMASRRLKTWEAHPFDILISDEHQRFATSGNKGQQAYEHAKAKFKLVMSADFFGSQLDNMWRVCRDTYTKEHVPMTFADWQVSYMKTEFDPFTYNKKKTVSELWPGYWMSTMPLYSVLPPSVSGVEPERWFVDLTAPERKAYLKLEEDMVAEVPDGLLVAEIPLTLRIRLRELSLGLVSPVVDPNTGKWTIEYRPGAPSAKLNAIKELLKDHAPHKFLIFSHSSKWVRWAANELRESGVTAAARTGKETTRQRDQDKSDFLRGDLRVLIAHPGTLAEGADGLQRVCSRVILASREDQSLLNTQGIDRIARQGQEEAVQAWDIVARDTYDLGVLHAGRARHLMLKQAKGA